MSTLSTALVVGAALGLAILFVQLLAVRAHVRAPLPPANRTPAISILKPLCGVDDDLLANIESLATLPYRDFEIVLGVKDTSDAAWPAACEAAQRWPSRVRIRLQLGEPGLNPKVNLLMTLARAARHDILVVSDSNVRVHRHYLHEIAAHLEDPSVGLVTHPIVGTGARRLGSAFDALQLTCGVAPSVIAARRFAGRDIVVGKSMAMRREDLEALGGLQSFKDLLAEDYAIGCAVHRRLAKRVALARTPICNLSRNAGLADFLSRYQRWAVIQRTTVGRPIYLLQALLNPLPLALAGFALAPSSLTGLAAAMTGLTKILLDAAAIRLLSPDEIGWRRLAIVPLKDLAFFGVWAYGLTTSRVVWRGNKLRVATGTRIVPTGSSPIEPVMAPYAGGKQA